MAKTATAGGGEIVPVRAIDAISERYLNYALSTIMSRSLPDVRDGLKPVHRRLIFAMQQLRLDPNSAFKKSARVVGDVIGKFHPHSDQAIYDALVRLAQDFALRYPLIDGQGNFGNVDGDNAAAMRYTEARLTEVAALLLEGIDEDAVDFRPTYDGEAQEPAVLPAAFPNLLANGAQGIAVGMATSIPPHNVAELCAALQHLIEKPKASVADLVALVPGPDFPTGGVLVEDPGTILRAYETGRGSFRLRARWGVERLKGELWQAVVTEVPYQVAKARLVERLAELMEQKKLPVLEDVRDESDAAIRLVLVPKNRNIAPEIMLEQLFRNSDLETKVSLNLNVLLADNTPRVTTLAGALQAFLDHRQEVLQRRSRHRLTKIVDRLEVLEAYLVAYLNIDEAIRIVRFEDRPKQELIARFDLTEGQAEAILNMRLRALHKLEEIEIRREQDTLLFEQEGLTLLLQEPKRQWKAIGKEIGEIAKRFGPETPLGRRRTEIAEPSASVVVPVEAFVEHEPVTVLCSTKGWIRAAKGHLEAGQIGDARYKEGDHGRFALHAMTTDRLLLIATNGRVYSLGADRLPGGRSFGEPLRLMMDLPNSADLLAIFVHRPEGKVLLASTAGHGFQAAEAALAAQTKNGKQAMNLPGGDETSVAWRIAAEDDHVAAIGENRRLLVFPLSDLPEMTRGRGVILQRYRDGGLSDAKTFRLEEGLTWSLGSERIRREQRLTDWIGKRAQFGRLPPNGFPKSNKFS
ncbi:MAG: DNA topoisomerase IV subunit A [Rhodospirillales bacterium]|nr:DNA topoisomerase IV subunit A [Rhodospirillales bacterium]